MKRTSISPKKSKSAVTRVSNPLAVFHHTSYRINSADSEIQKVKQLISLCPLTGIRRYYLEAYLESLERK